MAGSTTIVDPTNPSYGLIVNADGSINTTSSGVPTGGATAANQTSQITQETATAAVLGTTSGAAVVTDANGTIQQYLRGLIVKWLAGLAIFGGTAVGSAVANAPVTTGGRVATTNPTPRADGAAVDAMHDKVGRQAMVLGQVRDLVGDQKATLSNTTAEATIVTAVASTFLDVYAFLFANSGASTTKVDIRDTTGGAIRATFEVPTLETRGIVLPIPMKQGTVNTNWTAQCTTATTALEVTTFYVKNI